MTDFSNDFATSKYYNDSNKLVEGKMRGEMGHIAIEEFVGLKPRMYFILVINSRKYKK